MTISLGGQIIATKTASANAPTVKLLAPRAGSTVKKSLTVKWSGKDADGDQPDARHVDEHVTRLARFQVTAVRRRGTPGA